MDFLHLVVAFCMKVPKYIGFSFNDASGRCGVLLPNMVFRYFRFLVSAIRQVIWDGALFLQMRETTSLWQQAEELYVASHTILHQLIH